MTDEQAAEIISLLRDIRARLEDAVPKCSFCGLRPVKTGASDCEACITQHTLHALGALR